MVRSFYLISFVTFLTVGAIGSFWTDFLWTLVVLGPVFVVGVADSVQKQQGVRRNFPIIGNLRYFFEFIRPELQQYFVESNQSGRPIPREFRSVVYQRAKGDTQTLPFGTQRDVHLEHHEWINHSMAPKKVKLDDIRVKVGGPQCLQPYHSSILNISAMSYGSLSSAAVMALNHGAVKGNFSHNTGEGGVSPYHRKGGDLVWQIGTGYFGCRNEDGSFCPEKFKEKSKDKLVKMIELKISQGAKPGKGGILPGAKVTKEIAEIRGVPLGKDVISPPGHEGRDTPVKILEFVAELRELSDGKPIGLKLCIGKKSEFVALCKAMVKTGIIPDFITIDGSEGGTGSAPLEFTNSVGTPLEDGLAFAHDTLRGYGLRKDIRLIASGKIFTSFHMISKIALGADIINSARGMMLALGCIQALKCNTNHCPVGITSSNPQLTRGLHVTSKAERVARFHSQTIHAFSELVGAMGYESPSQIQRKDIYRRLSDGVVKSYEDLFPTMLETGLLDEANLPSLSNDFLGAIKEASTEFFHHPART